MLYLTEDLLGCQWIEWLKLQENVLNLYYSTSNVVSHRRLGCQWIEWLKLEENVLNLLFYQQCCILQKTGQSVDRMAGIARKCVKLILCHQQHTGQCKRTGGCYNELVVAFYSTGGGVKGKKIYTC